MPELNLNGISVNFPYEPYECQVNYMKCVLTSLTQVIANHSILDAFRLAPCYI